MEWAEEASVGADILPSATGCGNTLEVGSDCPGVQRQGTFKRDLSSSGGNIVAEAVTNCGSAGGAAIMLTSYELEELWAGIHSSRCRGQLGVVKGFKNPRGLG